MTNGTVVVLGPTGRNVAAGMTGGRLYVYDSGQRLAERLNGELVSAERAAAEELALVRELVERHHRYTGSQRAAALLERWDEELARWWHVAPKDEVAELSSAAEGTATRGS
jgi:glutamate synthase domain-containing protein 3